MGHVDWRATVVTIVILLLLLRGGIIEAEAFETRHYPHFEAYSIANIEFLKYIVEEVLSDKNLDDPVLVEALENFTSAILGGSSSDSNKAVARIRMRVAKAILEDEYYEWNQSTRQMLAYISSLKFESTILGLAAESDPVVYSRLISAMTTIEAEISEEEFKRTIIRIADVLESRDPWLSAKMRRLIVLLDLKEYEEASYLYGEVITDLASDVREMGVNQTVEIEGEEASLLDLIRALPSAITPEGTIRGGTNIIVLFIDLLNKHGVKTSLRMSIPRGGFRIGKLPENINLNIVGEYWETMNQSSIQLIIGCMLVLACIAYVSFSRKTREIVVSKAMEAASKILFETKMLLAGDPRSKIIAAYLTAVRILSIKTGLSKMIWETHREYLAKLRKTIFYKDAENLTYLYERAKFSHNPVTEVHANIAVEKVRNIMRA